MYDLFADLFGDGTVPGQAAITLSHFGEVERQIVKNAENSTAFEAFDKSLTRLKRRHEQIKTVVDWRTAERYDGKANIIGCRPVRELGYRVIWTPFAELFHVESVSRGYDDFPELFQLESVWREQKDVDPVKRQRGAREWQHMHQTLRAMLEAGTPSTIRICSLSGISSRFLPPRDA